MAENIVNSYNLFVDSSTGRDNASKGDNYHLHLGNAGITCESGQYIRLTLNNFTMHKTFTDVNTNNSQFVVRDTTTSPTTSQIGNLTHRNNISINSLASDFATQLGTAIIAKKGLGTATFTTGALEPSSLTSIGGNSDHIISFTLTCSTNHNIASTGDVICQMYSADGDSYELLGGNRVNSSTDTTTPSITITRTSATVLTVQCLYPAQRHSTSFIYLRGTGIPNTSIESTSLAHLTEDHRTDTVDSDILARIEVDVEYCNYEAQSGREYFMNIKQKQINTLSLRLTDAKNRPLGRVFGSSTNSTTTGITGSGTEQSTLGNLSFSAVIRVDIVQQRQIKELETKPLTHTTAARFDNVLAQPKFGRDAYGSGVGR
jgi:hypothetical protein